MQYTHIVWDFNGTILDDVIPCLDVLNIILKKRGLRTVNKAEYLEIFGFPIKTYYERVGLDFNKEDYGALADEWSLLYKRAAENSELCIGVANAFEYFKAINIPQYILSATEYGMLTEQVAELGIGRYFKELLALRDFHASSKVELGRSWAEREKPERVLFIGDTIHDYETAAAMGSECVLIAAGHQSKDRLLKCGVPVIDSAIELISFFEANNC